MSPDYSHQKLWPRLQPHDLLALSCRSSSHRAESATGHGWSLVQSSVECGHTLTNPGLQFALRRPRGQTKKGWQLAVGTVLAHVSWFGFGCCSYPCHAGSISYILSHIHSHPWPCWKVSEFTRTATWYHLKIRSDHIDNTQPGRLSSTRMTSRQASLQVPDHMIRW